MKLGKMNNMTAAGDNSDRIKVRLPGGRTIPAGALSFRAMGASGPGGQHVNKTATRVEVRVSLNDLPLRDDELQRVRDKLAGRINKEDELFVASEDSRHQLRNKKIAADRLETLLRDALKIDAPRRPTKMPRAVRERILNYKHRNSQRKRDRKFHPGRDD